MRYSCSLKLFTPVRLRVCASSLLSEVLFSVHLDQFKEVRQRQRSYQQSQNPEERYARQRAEQRNERMNVGPPLEDSWADHIVHVSDDHHTDQCEEHAGQGVAAEDESERPGPPYESAADDGQDGEYGSHDAPEHRVRQP